MFTIFKVITVTYFPSWSLLYITHMSLQKPKPIYIELIIKQAAAVVPLRVVLYTMAESRFQVHWL